MQDCWKMHTPNAYVNQCIHKHAKRRWTLCSFLHNHSVSELLFQGRDDRDSAPSLHLSHIPGIMSQIMAADSGTEIISVTSHLSIADVCSELIASKIHFISKGLPKMVQEASGSARNTACGFQAQEAAFNLCFHQQHMWLWPLTARRRCRLLSKEFWGTNE